jgi:hypothetical protein
MASPPGKSSKKTRFGKALERGFDRFRSAVSPNSRPSSPHGPALLGISTADIPKDAPDVDGSQGHTVCASSQHSSALTGANTAEKNGEITGFVGNRSQDALFSTPSHHPSAFPGADASDRVDETSGVVGNRRHDGTLPTSLSSTEQTSSRSGLKPSDKLKNAWGVAWNGLETALRVLERSADACPLLKSVLGGLIACLDLAQVRCNYRPNILDQG